jgi:hypothetical protein
MKRPLPPFLLALLLVVLLVLAPLPSLAAGLLRQPAPLVELQVVDRDSGAVLPQYRHRGQAWLPGEPGRHYAVRLRNLGPERVLVVLSVDGVNAVSGQTADPRQAGYVLGPWQSLDVDGWRKSLGTVARFVFVDPAASYAARTGRPDNIGVIGVAVFRETRAAPAIGIAGDTHQAGELRRGDAMESVPRAAGAADAVAQESAAAPSLGTGHGGIEWSPAYATSFERQAYPAQLSQLRYDTWYGLQARGISVAPAPYPYPRPAWNDAPQAFPGGFVADPPCCGPWPR